MAVARLLVLAVVGVGLVAISWTATDAGAPRELPVAVPVVVTTAFRYDSDHLGRNETLSELLDRHNVRGAELLQLLDAARARGLNPRRLHTDRLFEFRYPLPADKPDHVGVRLDDTRYLSLRRAPTGLWRGEAREIRWTIRVERAAGAVPDGGSLDAAIHRAIPDSVMPFRERQNLTWDLAEGVYAWIIDFHRDLRPGDRFQILYERLISDEGEVRYGRLLAANVETGGEDNTAYVLGGESGQNLYYNADGRSLHRAFLQAPVSYRHLSSRFGSRYHPILQRWRAHLGYDFAADFGTPIRATADGTVIYASRRGGYGLMVAIRHPKAIETRYAHMSRIASGIRRGVRVSQGDVIGFVGKSGLATGPHVHYEFLKNGRQVDYRHIDLGDGEPVPGDRRAEFDSLRATFDVYLHPPRLPTLANREWD